MLRSMYSGISGMKVNQTKLDVIGNNIANLGTTGFKASTVKFQDMLSQNMADATAPTANQGGINAQQVGLGVQLASIDTVMTQGMLQPTGRNLDIALDGGGFFMVSKGPQVFGGNDLQVSHKPGAHTLSSNDSGSEMMYTRAGTFILDQAGNLLTSDGYRVMGYPLTNDDNGMEPTGKTPSDVSTGGFDFRFGPGSQLNGFKVVLGAVGPGTVTDAQVDKEGKVIKLSGDFSKTSTMTKTAAESALNKALAAAGISQRIYVSGEPMTIAETGSGKVEGGSDATSPNSVSLMGVTFQFGEGSDLNGYTIKTGKINESGTSAEIDKDNKTITLNGNFMDRGALSAEELADAINGELSKIGITQEVIGIGTPTVIPGLEAPVKGGLNGKLPDTIKSEDGTKDLITFKMETEADKDKYSVLNGYKISVKQDANKDADAVIDKSAKTININYKVDGDATSILKKINDSFTGADIESINLSELNGQSVQVKGGEDKKAPDSFDIGGFTIKLPKGDKLNDYNFKIVDIETSPLKAEVKDKTIEISGDFLTSGNITADDMKKVLETALVGKIDGDITVSGRAKVDIESKSEMIDGGTEFKAPKDQSVFGLNIKFDEGESLNGYKVVIGDISSGTKTSAKVSDKEKTITINGNFVTQGAVTASAINSAVNKALKDKGIEQGVTITGTPNNPSGTDSMETMGGTPVQSLGEDGTISFVDGSQAVKAYDGGLKTLKIPDTVRMPGSDIELRVKSFNIDQQGIINCILEDGSVAAVGQLAIADFKNPEGLTKMGGNLYSASANSGEATIKSGVGTTGEDNSKGYASTIQGMIEMSNVDLAEQFTDMITTTRAFQASGKIINTGDEILQDIINLKR
ncbi:MAG: flagellar hook-basal body complex protein [Sarcina sp.]